MTEEVTNFQEPTAVRRGLLAKKPPGVHFERGDREPTMVEIMTQAIAKMYVGAPEPKIGETAVDYYERLTALDLPRSYSPEPGQVEEPDSEVPFIENIVNETEE